MHPEIKQNQLLLSQLYERNRSCVGFIDESYREGFSHDEFPFYTVTATVIAAEKLTELRADYVQNVGSWWHTTEMYAQKKTIEISDFIKLVASHEMQVVIAVQVQIENNDIEHARRECLVQVVAKLAQGGCNLVVYERREDNRSKNADTSLFAHAKAAGYVDRNLRLFAGHPAAEPLLWGLDLIGWALRRHLAVSDSQWIFPLLTRLEIIDASANTALKAKGPQPAAAKGSGPDSFVGLRGEGKNRSSDLSMPRFGDKENNLFAIFSSISQPLHQPEMLSNWLRSQYPNRRS